MPSPDAFYMPQIAPPVNGYDQDNDRNKDKRLTGNVLSNKDMKERSTRTATRMVYAWEIPHRQPFASPLASTGFRPIPPVLSNEFGLRFRGEIRLFGARENRLVSGLHAHGSLWPRSAAGCWSAR